MTLSFYHILCIFLDSLVVLYYPNVYKNTTRGTNFTINTVTLLFQKFYGYKVYFTTFYYNLKYISYIVKIGGGGYVVKTYPSIDPLAPPPNIYAYKCQINNIACCDVMTSQHVWLILSDGDQNDLARQQPRVVTQLRSI